ncbi:site-specific DNA-methyltransferase [Acinetobacter sp.]|jgi:site-specific DNA-methyltransferase (adenine-specific)|uniref:site-specific DNA-methyltransferase n=1 Tax=Acinetobacter sp. TaxID=472 RepID=UPI00282086DF|nr:site-specific DNA-methyltransferase [Acinetobacter sp.]MDR2248941.1 site-specific DNA-methyltransferase [Acinetobacter sp.]
MFNKEVLFGLLQISDLSEIDKVYKKLDIPKKNLKEYLSGIFPLGKDQERLLEYLKIDQNFLKLIYGKIDQNLTDILVKNAQNIYLNIEHSKIESKIENLVPNYKTKLGELYQNDCLAVLKSVETESIDLIFADPPFNLSKNYPSKMDDNLPEHEYILWTEEWLNECIRVLKPGGSLFIWNLPKWLTYTANYLNKYLTFKHWIAVDIKYSLPIKGRLYPSHYGLLYYVKNDKPNIFQPDRLQMNTCPHCFKETKDYGGYKAKMNPLGVSLTDVWLDISPVRHSKYKKRKDSNELSIKLLDRIIELGSKEGDIILDPFGGSGSTYAVCELKNRKWIGSEIGPIEQIIDRLKNIEDERPLLKKYRSEVNCLFNDKVRSERKKRKQWLPEDFIKDEKKEAVEIQLQFI